MITRHFEIESVSDSLHSRLAEYFSSRLDTLRCCEEAAWQARHAKEWDRLTNLWVQPALIASLHDVETLEQARLDWIEIERWTST